MLKSFLMATALVSVLALSVPAVAAEVVDPVGATWSVRVTGKVYAEPDDASKPVGTLKKGATLDVVGYVEGHKWLKVSGGKGKVGYVKVGVMDRSDAEKARARDAAKGLDAWDTEEEPTAEETAEKAKPAQKAEPVEEADEPADEPITKLTKKAEEAKAAAPAEKVDARPVIVDEAIVTDGDGKEIAKVARGHVVKVVGEDKATGKVEVESREGGDTGFVDAAALKGGQGAEEPKAAGPRSRKSDDPFARMTNKDAVKVTDDGEVVKADPQAAVKGAAQKGPRISSEP